MPEEKQRARFADVFRSPEFGSLSKWVVLSSVIGFLGGLSAVGFVRLTAWLTQLLFRGPVGITGEGVVDSTSPWWWIVGIPAAGGLAVGILLQTFAPEAEGHGTDSVIRAYHHLRGVIRKRVILLKAVASAVTIGSGGAAGQEGPIAQIGAGIGSTLATTFRLTDRDRRIFLLAGASAGVGATFCSPLGGALFSPEVLYRKPEFEGEGIIPCIISSIIGYTTFTALQGHDRVVELSEARIASLEFDRPRELIAYAVLGLACVLVGWLYTKVFYGVHKGFKRLKPVPAFVRPAIGGAVVGLLALALSRVPDTGNEGILFGGYGLIRAAIAGEFAVPTLFLLVGAKILATSFTISSGGSGGVFAPALAIGALLGAAIGQSAHEFFPGLVEYPATFALVGMGGFFAGVAKVPIAAVVMVCEMTGSYGLLAPLLLVAVVHMLLSMRWSMYEAQVDSAIDSPAHQGDFVVDVLQSIQVRDVFPDARHNPLLVYQDTTLKEVLRIVSRAKESYFPVVDAEKHLVGIFSLTDLRRIYLEEAIEDVVIVRDFMIENVVTTTLSETLDSVLRRMTQSNINAIPIVDEQDPRVILGLMERNEFGLAYDRRLRELKHEPSA